MPRSAEQRAGFVAEWIVSIDAAVAAAMTLEPLDPNGHLGESERCEWLELLSGPEVFLSVDDQFVAEADLRKALLSDSAYARMTQALNDPTSDNGKALRELLLLGPSEPLATLITAAW